jgi:DNA-binding MarR family transcriptional regulator
MVDIRDIWLHANSMIRSARQMINEDLRSLNLSSAEGNILVHLLTNGRELGQEQIVNQLDVSKPAISRALASLEKKGLVVRRRDPDDRRAYRVQLTEQALSIGPAITQIYNDIFALAVQGISQEELDHFMRLFKRISDNFARVRAKE